MRARAHRQLSSVSTRFQPDTNGLAISVGAATDRAYSSHIDVLY